MDSVQQKALLSLAHLVMVGLIGDLKLLIRMRRRRPSIPEAGCRHGRKAGLKIIFKTCQRYEKNLMSRFLLPMVRAFASFMRATSIHQAENEDGSAANRGFRGVSGWILRTAVRDFGTRSRPGQEGSARTRG
jgi:hypothetical protein